MATHSETETMSQVPVIGRIEPDEPWTWLAAGWRDYLAQPKISFAYGLVFSAVSLALTWSLFFFDLAYVLFPLCAGFLLLGPMLAVGLYETSRRIATNEPVTLRHALFVATASPTQLAFIGVLLTLMTLAWIRIATLIYALFFGISAFPGFEQSVNELFFTTTGLSMLAVGSVVGGVIAIIVFSAAAFSIPMLMVRDVDAITAMSLSIKAVRANLWPMIVWAWLIVVLAAVGMATMFIGLIITFPLLGHASWHAYQAVFKDPE